MKQLKNLTVILLVCLAFSAFSGTLVSVQACESASKLVFTAGTSQTLQVGTVSNQITVQLQDASSYSVSAGSNIVITLVTSASSSGHFYSDKNGQTQISTITIKQGQSSGSFYYMDTAAGNPTLTASSPSLKSATTQFKIQSSSPTPTPSASPSPSPSPSPSASPSPSPSPSSSPSPSPSPSPQSSPVPSPTPAVSPSPAPSTAPSTSPSPSPSPSATTSPAPSPTPFETQTNLSPTSNQPTTSTHKITVISAHGSATPSTNVKDGDSLIVQVKSPDGNEIHRWVCTGYSVDGGKTMQGVIYTFVNVQAAHTITFNWQEQYYLNVTSEFGSTGGSGWYNAGSTAHFTVTTKDTAKNGTEVFFIGWTGTGKNAYLGTETFATVTMSNPIHETAVWSTESPPILQSTSLYTVAETALILFALLIAMTLLLAYRRRRKNKQAEKSVKG
jgi:hypothetical protein